MFLNARMMSKPVAAVAILLLAGTLLAAAQDFSPPAETVAQDATCAPVLEQFYVAASKVCIGGPNGYLCNGGSAPVAEPGGPINSSLASVGALVPVDVVEGLTTPALYPDGSGGGLMWMRSDGTQVSAVLIGEVRMRDVPVEGFPAWQSIIVETGETPTLCSAAPRSAYIAQNSVPLEPARIVINGTSVFIAGTLLVQTHGSDTVFVTLDGQTRINAGGQIQNMVAGEQVRVPHSVGNFGQPAGAPSIPVPFDVELTQNLPMALLDRPVHLPQPGYVMTEGAVNLRSAPSTNAGLIDQVPAGQIMTILGRNPAGDWYHVRLANGQTGWMFAELLRRNHGAITRVYDATPTPPQRYGDVGTSARIQAPAGVNLRSAPDVGFSAIHALPNGAEVVLIARSPYSPWVKVENGGVVGWVALIAVETRAIIESLPIDHDVPPPPEPTRIPGSWGGAFPDPSCYPNC
jgi:uncharacterized protein YraI